MSTPAYVMEPDLTTAARRMLVAQTDLTSLLGTGPPKDDNPTEPKYATWVFRWRSYVQVKGSGHAAVILRQRGGWAAPNPHNTQRFPRLQVEVLVDPERHASPRNPVSATDAEDRCRIILDVLDHFLHLPQGGEIAWDTLRVLGSVRSGEPDIGEVPELAGGGDGLVSGLVNYDVNLG